MKKECVVIYFRESLLQSIIADLTTFGMLWFCVWFSSESKPWTWVCLVLFFVFLYGKIMVRFHFGRKNPREFTSKGELKKWLDKDE